MLCGPFIDAINGYGHLQGAALIVYLNWFVLFPSVFMAVAAGFGLANFIFQTLDTKNKGKK